MKLKCALFNWGRGLHVYIYWYFRITVTAAHAHRRPLLSVTPVVTACCGIWLKSWLTLVAAIPKMKARQQPKWAQSLSTPPPETPSVDQYQQLVDHHVWWRCYLGWKQKRNLWSQGSLRHVLVIFTAASSESLQSVWMGLRARTRSRGLRSPRAHVWSRRVHAPLAPVRSAGWQAHAQHISPSVT